VQKPGKVDTAGCGHRVELLGLWKISRRSRGGRLDVQGPLLTGPWHTTLVDATQDEKGSLMRTGAVEFSGTVSVCPSLVARSDRPAHITDLH
jgi:hypothetical protein